MNKDKMSFIIYMAIPVMFLALGIITYVDSILNPELTYVQIKLKYWVFYVIAGTLAISGVIFDRIFIKGKIWKKN